MNELMQDLRYAARSIRRRRTFAIVTILTIGLGVGATTAVFTVVNAVLLHTLPFTHADRLAILWHQDLTTGRDRITISPSAYATYVRNARSFDATAAVRGVSLSVASGGLPEAVDGVQVTPSLFDAVGLSPVVGRTFRGGSAEASDRRAAVISYEYWQRAFNGDSGVLGRTVNLRAVTLGPVDAAGVDGPYTIVGVLPPRATLLYRSGDIWLPLASEVIERAQGSAGLLMFARLKAGVSIRTASAEVAAISRRLPRSALGSDRPETAWLATVRDEEVGDVTPTLELLAAATSLLLLIVSANLGNMLLSRLSERRRELDVRRALGASRGRLVRQLMTESGLLALCGMAAGLAIAWMIARALARAGPTSIPRIDLVRLDGRSLLVALCAAAIVTIVFGAAPSLGASREVAQTLRLRAASGAGGRLRGLFVACQIALAFVVLTATGMVLTNARLLQRLDVGYDPAHVLTFRTALPSSIYGQAPQRTAFFQAVLARLRTLPGVTAAGAVSILPQMNTNRNITFELEGGGADDASPLNVRFRVASPGYFDAIGAPLIHGRDFSTADLEQGAVVISRTMRDRYWPRMDPIGHRVRLVFPDSSRSAWLPIVGVVADVRQWIVTRPDPTLYWANLSQQSYAFAVRSRGDPTRLVASVRTTVSSLDASQPIFDVRTQVDRVEQSQQFEYASFRALIMAAFGGVALLLAGLGIYGVMRWSVVQRIPEFGVRMALGATRGDIVRLVVSQSLKSILIGAIAGLAGSIAVGRLIAAVLVGVSGAEVATIVMVALLLAVTACVAAIGPAGRAGSVDPVLALRSD